MSLNFSARGSISNDMYLRGISSWWGKFVKLRALSRLANLNGLLMRFLGFRWLLRVHIVASNP